MTMSREQIKPNPVMHKGRMRNETIEAVLLGQMLKREALGLIPKMQKIYRNSGIYDAVVTLVGGVANDLGDNLSDFDYLFERKKRTVESLAELIIVTQDKIGTEISPISSRRIEAHWGDDSLIKQAFHQARRVQMEWEH